MNDKQMPAFPNHPNTHYEICGMTLRDYFAAKAMQTMCDEVDRFDMFASVAREAYKMADAMLEARAL